MSTPMLLLCRSPGTPFFEGTKVQAFIRRWKLFSQAYNVPQDRMAKELPPYYEDAIMLALEDKASILQDWSLTKGHLLENYREPSCTYSIYDLEDFAQASF
ncbi:hypothetical protein K7432_011905 [Basidiobolus ranarum]|uniref:Uncharacterized protein n=1 Tax=Basidiobolus ranarum TaxID=34480 RepID=A0ABR2VT41_9FUNG